MEFYTNLKTLTQEQKSKLIAEIPGWKYNLFYQAHPHLAIVKFFKENPDGSFTVPNGLLELIGLSKKEYPPQEFIAKMHEILKLIQPFELYDFQKEAIIDAFYTQVHLIQAATGSGKSVIIGLLAKLFIQMGLKGLILVPNVLLVQQFSDDLDSYNLNLNPTLIGGSHKYKGTLNSLTISTWQSMIRNTELCEQFDFLIIDETHTAKAHDVYEIALKCTNAKFKIGLTGTVPKVKHDFLKVTSVFGLPKTYISPRNLIDRGLGTQIKIKRIKLNYLDKPVFNDYAKALKFVIEHPKRNAMIVNLVKSLNGNTVILTSRNQQAFTLFRKLMPCETTEKSYKDLVLQNTHKIYFINGSIEGQTREKIRKILETETNAILVSNYSIMSTGVNIRNLHNLILAGPLKSFITITQSLGRLIRTHESKTEVTVYDLYDNFGFFTKQAKDRLKDCYEPQNYEVLDFCENL